MSKLALPLPRGRILILAAFLSLLLSTACLSELMTGGYDRADGGMMAGGMMPGGKSGGGMAYDWDKEWNGGWVGPYNGTQGLYVNGEGAARGAPDLAIISLGVEALADTAAEARTSAAAAMEQVMDALADAEIADQDIQTRHFNISPRYRSRQVGDEWESVLIGYAVTNRVSVKVRDLDDTGTVIDAVADAAGDLVRIDGINFAIEDDQKLRNEAQAAAVADMQRQAKRLAELAGLKLGRLVFLGETDYHAPAVYERIVALDAAESGLTPIAAGELEVNAAVQGIYLIIEMDQDKLDR